LFGEKLDIIMTALEVSNASLAKEIFLDSSYISRLRNGKRNLPSEPDFISNLSSYLFYIAMEKGRIKLLEDITGENLSKSNEDSTMCLSNWLTSRNNLKEMIKDLLQDISSHELKKDIDNKLINNYELRKESRYYYGDKEKYEAIITVLQNVMKEEKPKTLIWYSSQNKDYYLDDEEFHEELSNSIGEVLNHGHKIIIIYEVGNDIKETLRFIKIWIPFLISGNVLPYLYPRDSLNLLSRSIIPRNFLSVSENKAAIISLPTGKLEEDLLTVYIKDKEEISALYYNLEVFLEGCDLMLEIANKDIANNYKKMFDSLNKGDGSFYFMGNTPALYTLPENLAEKIQRENPNLNFLTPYRYGRKKFFKALQNKPNYESIILSKIEEHGGDYKLLFAGTFLNYSKEDYLVHIEEIIRLLKEERNYNLFFRESSSVELAIMIKEDGGLIAEKYNKPETLFFTKCISFIDVFICYFNSLIEGSKLKEKGDVIKYLESIIETNRS